MTYTIQAACHCHPGYVRQNNEDNFLFGDLSLQERNAGLSRPLTLTADTINRCSLAVFDGMGGEALGETAAFIGARTLYAALLHSPCDSDGDFSRDTVERMNQAVWQAAIDHSADRMGATVAMLTFRDDHVYTCNLGDSRIFRLRDGKFHQLSQDHTDEAFLLSQGIQQQQPRLTQHLGMDPALFRPEPYVTGFYLQSGDWYVICSDGLTDMLDPGQIVDTIYNTAEPTLCAQSLVDGALNRGGRDNVTVMVIRVV